MNQRIALTTLAAALVAACSQDRGITGPRAALAPRLSASAVGGSAPGVVYTLMNLTSGNAVAMFARAADGRLTVAGTDTTGGTGTGSGLGSQGALTLSDDGRWLFAVNAGSNDVSIFRVRPTGLTLTSLVPSGGNRPISLTVHGNLLYVLNAGGAGNVTGFVLDEDGGATPIPGATRPLGGAGPAQVAFSRDGRSLVVTEKTSNSIDVYAVDQDGVASGPASYPSAGGTPFGFAFGPRGEFVVSEAAGSASSYILGAGGNVSVASGAVLTHQGAPCWAVVTQDGRFAYTANAQSGTISGFAVGTDGTIGLLDASGATVTVGPGNLDLALSQSSRYLYQLRSSGPITALRVENDGHLTILGVAGAMPGSVAGLAAQ